MARDIDYAATAVRTAIEEKFGHKADLNSLEVRAGERTIVLSDGPRVAEGSRDNLLAALRASDSYDRLWESLSGN